MRIGCTSFADRCRNASVSALLISTASILAACAGVAFLLCAGLVWTDLLHANPGRTAAESAETALACPLFGLVLGVLWFGSPVAVGGVIAAVAIVVQGRLSRAGFAGAVAVATAVFAWSWVSAAPAVDDVSGEVISGPPWSTLVGGSALLIFALCVGWLSTRRRLATCGARPTA